MVAGLSLNQRYRAMRLYSLNIVSCFYDNVIVMDRQIETNTHTQTHRQSDKQTNNNN